MRAAFHFSAANQHTQEKKWNAALINTPELNTTYLDTSRTPSDWKTPSLGWMMFKKTVDLTHPPNSPDVSLIEHLAHPRRPDLADFRTYGEMVLMLWLISM